VRIRWGKQGRINLIGTLVLQGETEWLEYKILEGSCRSGEVIGYLQHLAERAEQEGEAVLVVLDRASFHRAEALQEERPKWQAKGLKLYYLPSYCPKLNLIEGVVAQA
jgi:transposase